MRTPAGVRGDIKKSEFRCVTFEVFRNAGSVGFTGWIGGVAVFNRALTQDELAQLASLAREVPLKLP